MATTRRAFGGGALACLLWARRGTATAELIEITKSPDCAACERWIEHLIAAGFRVRTMEYLDPSSVKRRLRVPEDLDSGPTSTVAGYVIEGYVPAEAILRLLDELPAITGLAVAGAPPGAPGVEGMPAGPYDVIAFDRAGNRSVFMTFEGLRRMS
jgi:hypothetical protein